jgi:chromosomal replication initiator protein
VLATTSLSGGLRLSVPEQLEPLWHRITADLRRAVPDFQFHIWLEPLEPAAIVGDMLYIRAPDHIRTWVGERYLSVLRSSSTRAGGPRAGVAIVGGDWEPPDAGPRSEPHRSGLNPKYTFQQFVIGDGNRFAHAASLAVAELPAQAYNPLFVHGRPGIGKTHLLHAIGNYVERYGSGLRVRYATIEDFTREFVEAVRSGSTSDFKDGFRKADVVLIDDVQLLSRGEATREEFFHTFNALVQSGRQLVITSDRHPTELDGIEQRLSERFRSGLVVELEPPSFAVRRAILAKRARLDGIAVRDAVLDEISLRVDSSVRALEGALIQIVAYASLRGTEPDVETARKVLGRLPIPAQRITDIVDATARAFDLSADELRARDRRPAVAFPRQVAMFLARELTDHSLPDIGRELGGRSHTTVLHALERVEQSLAADPLVRNAVDKVRRQLGASG